MTSLMRPAVDSIVNSSDFPKKEGGEDRVRIAILMPVYNESNYLVRSLSSIVDQSIRPAKIFLGDNESNDGSPELARQILLRSGITYRIETVPRIPVLGIANIQRVYSCLSNLVKSDAEKYDYIATIEADTTLEQEYFGKIIEKFRKDSKLGISAGTLEPFGLLNDPFPFTGSEWMLWGSNRVYKVRCWYEINDLVDWRCLPAWDTDHVILSRMSGYHVYPVPHARSQHLRELRPARGRVKARVDKLHGLPLWWVALKAVQYRDMDYLLGYFATQKDIWNPKCGDYYNKVIRNVYRYAAAHIVADQFLGSKYRHRWSIHDFLP